MNDFAPSAGPREVLHPVGSLDEVLEHMRRSFNLILIKVPEYSSVEGDNREESNIPRVIEEDVSL